MLAQSGHRFQNHIGDGVGSIFSCDRISAAYRCMHVGIAHAKDRNRRWRCTAPVTGYVQEEVINDLLRFI